MDAKHTKLDTNGPWNIQNCTKNGSKTPQNCVSKTASHVKNYQTWKPCILVMDCTGQNTAGTHFFPLKQLENEGVAFSAASGHAP